MNPDDVKSGSLEADMLRAPTVQAVGDGGDVVRMDPEVKAKWVAALRSGEYAQGDGQLRSVSNRFCCLGVLCDIHAKESSGEWVGCGYMGETMILNDEVAAWAGLPFNGKVSVTIGRSEAVLPVHNDGYWYDDTKARTFAEIADAIEAQL